MSAIGDMVTQLYKDEEGNPVVLSPTQELLFEAIATKKYPRVQTKCFTRFGKSFTIALAVLTRAATYPEKWAIVAPTKDKAKIIMNYINGHIFDNEYTSGKFRLDKGDSAESIRRHRNKSHITFDVGKGLISEIFITSAKEAIGLGAPNIVEDEASLIEDIDHALVMRMLGDKPDENFLAKIGNPFNRNHFLKSDLDPAYKNITIDCYQGLAEGRISQGTIEENRPYSFFPVLYECKFPPAEAVDEQGWSYLITENDINISTERIQEPYGRRRLGIDVARGGRNYNVWVLRQDNYAKVLRKSHDNDLMSVVGTTIDLIKTERILPEDVYVDDVGIGGGVTDRLREQGYNVKAVKEGEKASDPKEYANMKAELYAGKDGLANWLKRAGRLEPHEGWVELTRIRYKKDSSGRTKIESKDDMRKRGEESPDVADALMLTFAEGSKSGAFMMPDPRLILEQGQSHTYGL
jgi:hypothetical protein